MELLYFWVKEFRNLKETGINLGSQFIYDCKLVNNTLEISRKENKEFIPDFFSLPGNSKGFSNVTAIVGENGVGKTNLLEVLRRALVDDDTNYQESYLLIYEKDNTIIIRNTTGKRISAEFNIKEITHYQTSDTKTEVIYYSPHFDQSIYPIAIDQPLGIDVSTDWLLHKDSAHERYARNNLDVVEYFKSQETFRQIEFVKESIGNQAIESRIKLPTKIQVKFQNIRFDIENHRSNTPYDFRTAYNKLKKLIEDEIDLLADREYLENEKTAKNQTRAAKGFEFFLLYLLNNVFYNLDQTNQLEIDQLTIQLKDISFNSDNYFNVIDFFENQDIVDSEPITHLILYIERLIENIRVIEVSHDQSIFEINIENTYEFISIYNNYLKSLERFSHYTPVHGFIDLDWSGLSSGQKAFLNIFSRINFSKKQIISKSEDYFKPKQIPKIIYLLVDEGDLGFHPQWQKDFLIELINIIPHILEFEKDQKVLSPRIQLIFTSHSPLCLSDIPQSHVVYLYEQGTLNHPQPKKSFGANIHNLLADSFFLKDGLVGKFAVKKINEIIEIINRKNVSQEDQIKVEQVLAIIDEPLLKRKLEMMYLGKHKKISEKEMLQRQMEEIQKRLKDL